MFNLGSYVKETVKGFFESLAWEALISILEYTALFFAYVNVILKRAGLRGRNELLTAASLSSSAKYARSLVSLENTVEDDFFGDCGFSAAEQQREAYASLAAQILLQNAKNRSSFGHSFHVLSPSQLPVLFALAVGSLVFFLLLGLRADYHGMFSFAHCIVLAAFAAIISGWILMAFREEIGGAHTLEVQQSFRIGIVLFIASELMLFFAFFWAFFHFCLNPSAVTNGQFVAEGIVPFFWYRIPLLNTVILLSSGISLTLAHGVLNFSDRHQKVTDWSLLVGASSLLSLGDNEQTLEVEDFADDIEFFPFHPFFITESVVSSLFDDRDFACFRFASEEAIYTAVGYSWSDIYSEIDVLEEDFRDNSSAGLDALFSPRVWVLDTIVRGGVFLTLQAYEYISGLFTIADSVYGAVFYSLTGLHGLHVFVGVLMLMGAFIFEQGAFGTSYAQKWWYHRVAFDGVAWYWHFVDVVWLFVFIFVYWYSFPANYLV